MSSKKFQTKLLGLQNHLLNFTYSLTSTRDDAYKALDNEAKYAHNSNFKGWVFTIIRNTFINNYWKSAHAATIPDQTEDLHHLRLSHDSRIDIPEGAMAEKEISAAINSFSDEYRIPFSMHVVGYRYEEIAQRMQLPLVTIKSRIFFAHKRLQIQLKGRH